MAYVKPADVISPKARWSLIDVLLDRGEGECAYALGIWDGQRRIGFRWNGTSENELGNPQSRGLPTWTMLDEELHREILEQLPIEKRGIARSFLDINLMLEGPVLEEDGQGDLIFYDFFQAPHVLVRIPCTALRDAVQRPEILDVECQLLAMRHKDVLTSVAAEILAKGGAKVGADGRYRVLRLDLATLSKVSNQLSTDVLAVAAVARWGG